MRRENNKIVEERLKKLRREFKKNGEEVGKALSLVLKKS